MTKATRVVVELVDGEIEAIYSDTHCELVFLDTVSGAEPRALVPGFTPEDDKGGTIWAIMDEAEVDPETVREAFAGFKRIS